MRPLPEPGPDLDRRIVIRVPPQPYVHVDRNDYSLDPRLVGRRVEVRVSQREVVAVALDTGELAARHRRVFAAGQELTDPAHQQALERLRLARYRGKPAVGEDVELRDLSVYDRLAGVMGSAGRARAPVPGARRRQRPPARCRSSPTAPGRRSGAMSGSCRRCLRPRCPPATATAARHGSARRGSRRARRWRSSTSPSSAASRRR